MGVGEGGGMACCYVSVRKICKKKVPMQEAFQIRFWYTVHRVSQWLHPYSPHPSPPLPSLDICLVTRLAINVYKFLESHKRTANCFVQKCIFSWLWQVQQRIIWFSYDSSFLFRILSKQSNVVHVIIIAIFSIGVVGVLVLGIDAQLDNFDYYKVRGCYDKSCNTHIRALLIRGHMNKSILV